MSIGFKEWTLICDALGRGEQSIVIRKGGIAEGRSGFRFQHPAFFLFPTLFHEQVSKLKLPSDIPLPPPRPGGQIEIQYHAQVEWTRDLTDLDFLRRLAPFHLWRDEVVEERFRYDVKEGVSVALLRVAKCSPPFILENSPKYGGCRSWVNLPEPPAGSALENVIDDATHRGRDQQIRALL